MQDFIATQESWNRIEGDRNDCLEAFENGVWSKYLAVPGLILLTIISLVLTILINSNHVIYGGAKVVFVENRAVANILAHLLGAIHVYALCTIGPSHRWKDVSTSLYSSQPDAKFGSPFNSVLASEGFRGFAEGPLVTTPSVNKSTGAYVRTVFHDLYGSDRGLNSNSIVFSHYANGSFTTGSRVNITGPSLPQSDIVQPGLPSGNLAIVPLCAAWVNGSTLSPICPLDVPNPPQNAPISAYPFKRLASTTAPNSTIFYIYHQLDAVTFAEDWWDQEGSGGWMTSKFSIETV